VRGDFVFAAMQTRVGEKQVSRARTFLMKHVEIDVAVGFHQDAHAIAAMKNMVGADALGASILLGEQRVTQSHVAGLTRSFGRSAVGVAGASDEKKRTGSPAGIALRSGERKGCG